MPANKSGLYSWEIRGNKTLIGFSKGIQQITGNARHWAQGRGASSTPCISLFQPLITAAVWAEINCRAWTWLSIIWFCAEGGISQSWSPCWCVQLQTQVCHHAIPELLCWWAAFYLDSLKSHIPDPLASILAVERTCHLILPLLTIWFLVLKIGRFISQIHSVIRG